MKMLEYDQLDQKKQSDQHCLISIALITYNQEKYIAETLESLLNQTYSPLEIIVSDDHSSDKTYDIIQEMVQNYDGPHKVILNRNEANLGIQKNFNRTMRLTHGEYIVMADGDDISRPERVERSWQIVKKNPDCSAVSFQMLRINPQGNLLNTSENWRIKVVEKKEYRQSCYTLDSYLKDSVLNNNNAVRMIRRDVYTLFGDIPSFSWAPDTIYKYRALLLGKTIYSQEPMLFKREFDDHINNYTGQQAIHKILGFRTAMINDVVIAYKKNLIDFDQARKLIHQYTDLLRYPFETLQYGDDAFNMPMTLRFMLHLPFSTLSFKRQWIGYKTYIKHWLDKITGIFKKKNNNEITY